MTGAFQPIGAPPASPPRHGLLAVVGGESAEPALSHNWQLGIAFEPEACLPQQPAAWADCPENPGEEGGGIDPRDDPGPKVIGDNEPSVYYRPWMAWVGDKCTTLSGQGRDPVARARRLYAASESRIMEAELESGTAAQVAAYPNNYLRNSAAPNFVNLTPGPGSSSPGTYALQALQEAIAAGQTGRGMIHATLATVSFWFTSSALRREGGLILDVFDNIVVAGTGYLGASPDGTPGPPVDPTGETSWAYATGIIQTKRDPQVTVIPDRLAEAVRLDTNDEEWRVERVVAAWWDGCVQAAVNVNLCATCCDPTEAP